MIYYIYREQWYKSILPVLPVQIWIDQFRSNGFQIDALIFFNLKIDFINHDFLFFLKTKSI